MMTNSKIGMALVGGYLLGRTRKAKMAIGMGMFLAGKKLDLSPQQLAKTVANSPVLGQLSDQVRKDLVDNTKSALTSAVTQRAGSLADSLHERTLDLNDPTRRLRGSDDAEDGAEDEYDAEDGAGDAGEYEETDDTDDTGGERADRPQARKPAAAGSRTTKPAKSAGGARKTATSGTRKTASSSARKASSGSGSGSGSGARRSTSGAGRSASGARKTATKTASGGARKATNRGGGNG